MDVRAAVEGQVDGAAVGDVEETLALIVVERAFEADGALEEVAGVQRGAVVDDADLNALQRPALSLG